MAFYVSEIFFVIFGIFEHMLRYISGFSRWNSPVRRHSTVYWLFWSWILSGSGNLSGTAVPFNLLRFLWSSVRTRLLFRHFLSHFFVQSPTGTLTGSFCTSLSPSVSVSMRDMVSSIRFPKFLVSLRRSTSRRIHTRHSTSVLVQRTANRTSVCWRSCVQVIWRHSSDPLCTNVQILKRKMMIRWNFVWNVHWSQ